MFSFKNKTRKQFWYVHYHQCLPQFYQVLFTLKMSKWNVSFFNCAKLKAIYFQIKSKNRQKHFALTDALLKCIWNLHDFEFSRKRAILQFHNQIRFLWNCSIPWYRRCIWTIANRNCLCGYLVAVIAQIRWLY